MPFEVGYFPADEGLADPLEQASAAARREFGVVALDAGVGADIVVLPVEGPGSLARAQGVAQARPRARILFLAPPGRLQKLRDSLPFIPGLATAWTASLEERPAALAAILLKAAGDARQRSEASTVFSLINARIARSTGGADEAENQRLRQIALSEDYLATLIFQAPDGLVALSTGGVILTWNEAATRLFGIDAEAAVGLDASDALPAEVMAEVRDLIAPAVGGAAVAGRQVRFTGPTGARWVEFSLAPVQDDGRRVSSLSMTIRDVTAQKRAELQLRASEDRYRTLTETLPQLVWTCRPDGACDYLSRQWVIYTGIAEAEQLGFDWLDRVIHPDDRERTLAHWRGAVEGRHPYDIEYRIRAADGAYRWFKTRGTPIRGEGGETRQWFGTCTDIQEIVEARETLSRNASQLERRVEEEIGRRSQAEEALRQSQKMEAVGQLTGGIAHDFNNLLAGITGSLELIEKRMGQGRMGETSRYVEMARSSARRAAALTQRLLAFSRRQTLDPRPTDVNRLIAGMSDLIRRSVGPEVTVEVVEAGGLWTTRVDVSQLENALLNLSINARDAMAPEGGRLTIETANKWLDEREAAIRDLPPGRYVSLCVTDTGSGMSPDVAARIFDPFFTTKPLGQGTGLGLSMVYGFVRQSGGQVRVYSEIGKGTTMCLYLPRYYGDAGPAEAPGTAPIGSGDGETIMVIDDEPAIRLLIADVLREHGYQVLDAGDGPSGLRILETQGQVDLLITDVGLPGGMNGRQVADAARVARPRLCVLFITGYAENAVVGNGDLEAGMEVITKPFVMDDFAGKVRDLLDRA